MSVVVTFGLGALVFRWLTRPPARPVATIAFPAHLFKPLLGMAMEMEDVIAGTWRLCIEGAEDGLSSFYLLGAPCVSVTKAEHVRQVLLASNYRSPIWLLERHIKAFLGQKALVVLMHDEWKCHRRVVSRAFKWEHLVCTRACVRAGGRQAECFITRFVLLARIRARHVPRRTRARRRIRRAERRRFFLHGACRRRKPSARADASVGKRASRLGPFRRHAPIRRGPSVLAVGTYRTKRKGDRHSGLAPRLSTSFRCSSSRLSMRSASPPSGYGILVMAYQFGILVMAY